MTRTSTAILPFVFLGFASLPARAQVETGTTSSGQPSPSEPSVEPTSPVPESDPLPLPGAPPEDDRDIETIYITGEGGRVQRVAGSAQIINEEALSRFEYDDVTRILTKVPGVYIRDEDGFGLRPNIGIRGVSSDRSAKIVLLEDGVLLGPAPYAAPAAYFVPLTTRMIGLEVFKGPAAIRTGPYTVGGAINYLTAEVPTGHDGQVDVAAGQFGYVKAHGRYGWGNDFFGFLVEGVRLSTSGFKELDGGGDTGFEKNEVMVKLRANTDPVADVYHRFEVKAGWADELSNETYLGLTREDFEATPYRRYRASALANMDWERTQIEASWNLWVGDSLEARLVGYRHDLTRAWFKLNQFADGTPPREVLRGETAFAPAQLDVLRGRPDPDAGLGAAGLLRIGTNDRTFVSQGVQLDGELRIDLLDVDQRIRFGARLHYDEVARNHTEDTYEMVRRGGALGSLVRTDDPRITTLINLDSALAVSAYLQDDVTLFDALTVTPGARMEIMSTRAEDPVDLADPGGPVVAEESTEAIFVPGVGLFYQLVPELGLLAGVYRGFSPVAPGQPEAVEPELSWNYEAGARFRSGASSAEIVGFFNDYQNLLVACTFSAGCPDSEVNKQFNAGTIWIYGIEAQFHQDVRLPLGTRLVLDGSYTLTLSEFRNDFRAGNPQFEDVREGDRLPYVPEHQGSVSLIFEAPVGDFVASAAASYTFVDRMRDSASSGDVGDAAPGRAPLTENDFTDQQHVLDLALQLDLDPATRFYVRIDNLLDQAYIASYRPFGARPGRPLFASVGFTHRFGPEP